MDYYYKKFFILKIADLEFFGFLPLSFVGLILTYNYKYTIMCDENCINNYCFLDYKTTCICFNNYTKYCDNKINKYNEGFNECRNLFITSIISFFSLHLLQIFFILFILNLNKEIFKIYMSTNRFYHFQIISYLLYLIIIVISYFNTNMMNFKYKNICPENCFIDENDKDLCACYDDYTNTFTFLEKEEEITQYYKIYNISFGIYVFYSLFCILINSGFIHLLITFEKIFIL
jgi:hypothetical protein